MKPSLRLASGFFSLIVLTSWTVAMASAQIVPTNDPPVYGPYNAAILQGGDGVHKKMVEKDTVLRADSPWTMYAWVQVDAPIDGADAGGGIWRCGGRVFAVSRARAGQVDAVDGSRTTASARPRRLRRASGSLWQRHSMGSRCSGCTATGRR